MSPAEATAEPALASVSFEVWGSDVVLATARAGALEPAERLLRAELEAFDRACSRFRADSELTRLNARAGAAVEVGPLLADALAVALRSAEQTAGAVDPTVGPALAALGYDRDFAEIVRGASVRPMLVPAVGWREIAFDAATRTVLVPRGCTLDLGATAKALCADRAAAAIAARTGVGVLVSLGGDVAMEGRAPDGGWVIGLADDHRAPARSGPATVAVAGGGLATSSTTVRRWRMAGEPVHHLIDPASGRPAGGPWRTASVAAASCTDANTASTAAIVMGVAAADWLAERGLPARLVAHDGTIARIAGWPEES